MKFLRAIDSEAAGYLLVGHTLEHWRIMINGVFEEQESIGKKRVEYE